MLKVLRPIVDILDRQLLGGACNRSQLDADAHFLLDRQKKKGIQPPTGNKSAFRFSIDWSIQISKTEFVTRSFPLIGLYWNLMGIRRELIQLYFTFVLESTALL